MKRYFLPTITFLLFFSIDSNAQSTLSKPFVSDDIFQTRYFIKNRGQFNSKFDLNKQTETKLDVKYGIDNNEDKIYFTSKGFIWSLVKLEKNEDRNESKRELEEERDKHEENIKSIEQQISLQWLNTNPKCEIFTEGESMHYFTYGEEKYNSYGYEKIIYKELYPNIDIEYIVPKRGGIKYSLILHPGADLRKIKCKYSGRNVKVFVKEDKLFIKNNIRDLVESELKVYYENGTTIQCKFYVKNHEIGFAFLEAVDVTQKIIIDPWISSITTLTSSGLGSNSGYDVDYDYQGNLYVYGGGYSVSGIFVPENTKIAKYSASGILLWTFNGTIVSPSWESKGTGGKRGNFWVNKTNQQIYTAQGYNNLGTAIVRLDANGVYDNYISPVSITFQEIWDMNFDCLTQNILAFGGGTWGNLNLGIIDTLGVLSTVNFTGLSLPAQDVVSGAVTKSGEVFVALCSNPISPIHNTIVKLNSTLNGNNWIQPIGFLSFIEQGNKPYAGLNASSNGYNALYANNQFLFYYDGINIKAFDKSSGLPTGTSAIVPSYLLKLQGGIYADDCNHIYLGGNNGNILVYYFNGVTFNPLPDITLTGMIGKHIYDIKYNDADSSLYVSGETLVAKVPRNQACVDSNSLLNITVTTNCFNAYVNVINGDSNSLYTYIWTDSNLNTVVQTHSLINELSDTLNSIIPGHVYTVNVQKNEICNYLSKTLTFTAISITYLSVTTTICNGQSIQVNSNTYSVTGIYLDTLINSLGCDTILTTNLNVIPVINNSQNVTICAGQSLTINGNVYSSSGIYIDSLVTTFGCDSVQTTNLTVAPNSAFNQNITLCFGQSITVNGNTYFSSGNYSDTMANSLGCDSVITTFLQVNPNSTFNQSFTICNGQTVTVNGNIYSTTGIFNDTLNNTLGCDSIIITNLTVEDHTKLANSFLLCNGESYSINGHTYTITGTYIDTLPSSLLCDTIITTNLTIGGNSSWIQNINLCDGQSVVVNGNTYSTTGNFADTILNSNGCDSIIYTHLLVSPHSLLSREIELCKGQSVTVNNHTYSTTGNYSDTLINAAGCDSVVITALEINGSADGNFFIPNVFTPNGDNLNDCFGLKNWNTVDKLTFIIYNRWGQLVFEADKVSDCWDGNFINTKADVGVYFYFIKVSSICGDFMYKGDVTLIR